MPAQDPPGHSAAFAAVPMAAWLELFYDLIFVAAILVFSSAASHLHDAWRIAWVVGVFTATWWVWVSTTMFVNRFRVDDVVQRLLVIAQMFLVVVLAVEAREGVVRDATYLSTTFAALIATVAVMYGRVSRSLDPAAGFARSRATFAAASAAIFVVAAPFDEPVRPLLWAIGLAVTILPVIAQSGRLGRGAAIDEHHVVERFGAFTIIVCGEAFVKVAIAVSTAEIVHIDLTALAFQFVLVLAIWASYFEDVPHAGIARNRFAPWVALHLAVQLCIAGIAIGVAKMIAVGPLDHLPAEDILEVTVALAAMYVGLGLLGACTRRTPARPLLVLRMATAAVVVAVGVAAWLIPQVELVEGVALLTITALVHSICAARLRARTVVRAEV